MSYLFEILRKKNGKLDPIQREEIQALAQDSSNMHIGKPTLKSAVIDLTILANNGNVCVLTLRGGKLLANNAKDTTLPTMLEIARKLNARLRGDDFETYESLTKTYLHPDDVSEKEEAEKLGQQVLRQSKRQHQYIKFGIIFLFAVLGLVVFSIGKMFEH